MNRGGQGRVLVVGSLNVDLVIESERMPALGETILGGAFHRQLGGKGANQAVAAARLGAAVTMVGAVGDDPFGKEMISALKSDGIDVSHVKALPDRSTGVAVILLEPSGQNRIIVSPGANYGWGPESLRGLGPAFAAADVVLVQLEIDLSVVDEALRLANEVGTKVILNPAPAMALEPSTLARANVLTPNEVELAQLTGSAVGTLDEVKRACRQLLDLGVPGVVVTLGERGALVVTGPEEKHMIPVDGYPVRAVDTVGAGDAFNGALAASLAEGMELVEAARAANAAAAISVTRTGAQAAMPTRDDVAEFLRLRSAR